MDRPVVPRSAILRQAQNNLFSIETRRLTLWGIFSKLNKEIFLSKFERNFKECGRNREVHVIRNNIKAAKRNTSKANPYYR